MKRILIPIPTGNQISQSIKSQNSRPNAWVYVDIKTSNIGGFVAKAKNILKRELSIPPGYTLVWSGQFEYLQRAEKRQQIVVPITGMIIFLLLYLNFRNLVEPLVVMLSIPFALIGGIWLIFWFDYNFSVAVAVRFIALAGTAIEIGVLVLSFINIEIDKRRKRKGARLTESEIADAVQTATSRRVRPVAMTAVSTMAGLIPIVLSTGTGTDLTHRIIAMPMPGGMLTVTFLNLLVLPVIYSFILQFREKAG